MLQSSVAWLNGQLRLAAGELVTYKRGILSAVVMAIPTKDLLRVSEGGDNAFVVWTDSDFIIAVADLKLASILVEPQAGDQIVRGALTFEVDPIGSEPAWRYTDGTRMLYRIHTRQIAP